MAQRKVVWTETAAYPIKLVRLSDAKADQVAQNPLMYKEAEFPDTRTATMGHYSLFYKVTEDAIIVTAFWDNRQAPKELLELLKAHLGITWLKNPNRP